MVEQVLPSGENITSIQFCNSFIYRKSFEIIFKVFGWPILPKIYVFDMLNGLIDMYSNNRIFC